MAVAMGVLLAAVLGLPWLRQLMGLALPGLAGLAAGAALLALCVLWLELVRLAGVARGHAGAKAARSLAASAPGCRSGPPCAITVKNAVMPPEPWQAHSLPMR